ncbi:unnamed protein product [marine sediment metagenome]|uniref:Uncharacterized protein n=1 Tax=marine sediment metagenome TaxID=412755 RepID=X1S8Z2_9ZZZZ
MPLPKEVLETIKKRLDEAEEAVKSVEDVLADMRVTGIGVGEQEEKLKAAKADLRKLRLFYDRQVKKAV